MSPEELRARTQRLAVSVIRFYKTLPVTELTRIIGRQLLRSGPGVGAGYRAVCRSRSDPEFIAKPGVAIEESDETAYWLEILVQAELVPPQRVNELHREADELTRVVVKSRETARKNARARAEARARKRR